MGRFSLLDCTLRDGGYVNNWCFGYEVICDILLKLVESNVDYIECGYLSKVKGGNLNSTQFSSLNDLRKILPVQHENQKFAIMINFGEYPVEELPPAMDSLVVRVCFHKKDAITAIEYCQKVKEKGYRVFVQPMATMNYSDEEFVELIKLSNKIMPDAFYLVDSFGMMESSDLIQRAKLADEYLFPGILLGYHSHNNLQQAYGNAKEFVNITFQHECIIDASVYGMGRGAGNLNLELFCSYCNRNYGTNYRIDPLLDIMDIYLKPIFNQQYWGYSLPFYLSAHYNCHPNYASYFADKNTLTNKSIKELLKGLPEDIKHSFSKVEAEKYYQAYQRTLLDDSKALGLLQEAFGEQTILVLAPGKNILDCKDDIVEFIKKEHPIIIGVNVAPMDFECDFLICTNEKRLKRLQLPKNCQLILTSNLSEYEYAQNAYKINYSTYLSAEPLISDNPTLMLISLLIRLGKQQVYLAGFDGYSTNPAENYFDSNLSLGTSLNLKVEKNRLISQRLKELQGLIDICFVTKSRYQK